MFCSKCGFQVADSLAFCEKCGTSVHQGFYISQPNDQVQQAVELLPPPTGSLVYPPPIINPLIPDNPRMNSANFGRGFVRARELDLNIGTASSMKERFIAFDVETTGLSPSQDRIIEIGAVLFQNGEATAKYSTLINPLIPIPPAATRVNRIENYMLQTAPHEAEAYADLVRFLGDALNEQTIMCAHNAKFDIDFLSETLVRLGYNARICYVDTLYCARSLIKGLDNYKQNTISTFLGLTNSQAHRAESDAEICGRILLHLLSIKDKEQIALQKRINKSRPTDEEMEICAFIQDKIVKQGGDTDWLGFTKQSGNYVAVSYLYTMVKFKFAKKGCYIIIAKDVAKNTQLVTEPCTMTEGGTDYLRVFFTTPSELEPLAHYFYQKYASSRKSMLEFFHYYPRQEKEARDSLAMLSRIPQEEVELLLRSAERRKAIRQAQGTGKDEKATVQPTTVKRSEIVINPIHDRVPVDRILHLNDWSKGFDEGYPFWEQGDKLRKSGDIESAIRFYDKARYFGYCAPALFESYAMAYQKLGDFDNVIQILDEGLDRCVKGGMQGSWPGRLEARRDKAVQQLYKQRKNQNNNNNNKERKVSPHEGETVITNEDESEELITRNLWEPPKVLPPPSEKPWFPPPTSKPIDLPPFNSEPTF